MKYFKLTILFIAIGLAALTAHQVLATPTISSVSPNTGSTATTTSITITGLDFEAEAMASGGYYYYTDTSGLNPRRSSSYTGGYTVHNFPYGTRIKTIKFYVKGAADYSDSGEFYFFDLNYYWIRWIYSYTTSWTEITLNIGSSTSYTVTNNTLIDWNNTNAYRFDINTTGRTVYIDNVRFYDENNNLVDSNMAESITSWDIANGSVAVDSTEKQQGTYSIKLVSSGNDCYSHYNPSGTWDWSPTSTTNSFSFVPGFSATAQALIIAGGGGAAGYGNYYQTGGGEGGGAGGYRYLSSVSLTPQTYTIVIGKGGVGGAAVRNSDGSAGNNSSAFGYTSTGGGGGGTGSATSGGTSGAASQGGIYITDRASGGGGSATAGTTTIVLNNGGPGGNGTQNSISGTSTYYSGGGGGGATSQYSNGGSGGSGGGGKGEGGSDSADPSAAVAGTSYTGGGGGAGANWSGGKDGGSGVVIVRYPTPRISVSFGTATATNITWLSSTTVTATAPAHSLGAVNVVVTNPDGATTTLAGGFTYWDPPVEFVSVIDPDNASGTDYTSLSAWENAVQSDLTDLTTTVFSYNPNTASGTMPDGFLVTGETSGATGTLVHKTASSASAQIMIKNVSGGFAYGEKVYLTASSSNYVYISSYGNPVIAVAKCRSTAGSADTTAVTIDGWTTSSSTYIKIWTDPTDPYGRHRGKWDEGKYRLISSTEWTGVISNFEEYVEIYGLQIENQGNKANNSSGIFADTLPTTNSSLIITDNIIKATGSGVASGNSYGIRVGPDINSYLFNNIIYDYGSNIGIIYTSTNVVSIINNNTSVNGVVQGIGNDSNSSPTISIYNNIAQGSATNYSVVFLDNGSNNISSDGTAPGTNSYASTTVQFLDEANDDFHLAANDTAARNAGVALTETPQRGVSTDVDGTARGAAWDIGADEVPVEFVSTICQATSTGGACSEMDYGSLASWEDKVEVNLSSSTTRVFGGSITGSLSENNLVYLRMSLNGTSTASGYVVATTSDQILIDGIVGSTTVPVIASTSYVWQYNGSNYWTVSGAGDAFGASPIAIAKIDGAWSASDTSWLNINGWETDNDNYIKIYTTNIARHDGKWNTNKYRLSFEAYTYTAAVYNYEKNTRIDGLQVEHISATQDERKGILSFDDIYLSNSIIRLSSENPGSASEVGIRLSGASSAYLSNNIVMGWWDGINIGDMNPFENYIVYNNTVIDSIEVGIGGWGYPSGPANVIFKNNIVQNKDAGGRGFSFDSNSNIVKVYSNNVSNNGYVLGSNSYSSTTVAFVSTSTNDFHLANNDTAAIDRGVSLRDDANLKIIDDIDGSVRANGFDVGADETAIKIYRSVGPSNTTALSTGSSTTLTISGLTATFNVAQPNNVGVGDAVQYDSDGNGSVDAISFIHKRISNFQFLISKASGTPPVEVAGDQDWSIYRAYTSLFNAEAGTENTGIISTLRNFDEWSGGKDLVGANQVWNIACYGDAVDTVAVTIDGWTTGEYNFLKVFTPVSASEVGVTQRHSGRWDDTKYNLNISNTSTSQTITVNDEYVSIDGIQLYANPQNGFAKNGILSNSGGNYLKIYNSIIKTNTYNIASVKAIGLYSNGPHYVFNNIIYEWNNNNNIGIFVDTSAGKVYVLNNTIIDSYTGIRCEGAGDIVAINNIIQDCVDGYSGNYFDSVSDYNISDIAGDSPNTTFATTSKEVIFVDEENYDFHLAPGSAGIDVGTSTGFFADAQNDIDGDLRRTWDIGADEASVEFVSTVMQSGGAFTSLSAWETANQVDLTATSTAVFSCASTNGAIPVGSSVVAETPGSGVSTGGASTTVMSTTTNQILLYNISGTILSGDKIYIQGAASTSNYCILSNAGNPAIAVAKIDGAWTSVDINTVIFNGWETGTYNYIKIYTTQNARHQGKWNDGRYRRNEMISNYEKNIRIDGLQISISGVTGIILYSPNDSQIYLSNNIIKSDGTEGSYDGGIYYDMTSINSDIYVYNNIIYGFRNGRGISLGSDISEHFYVYNNTVSDCFYGFRIWSASSGTFIVKNNLAYNNTTDYYGTFSASSTHNLSKDATAPAFGTYYRNATVAFQDETNDDFHLVLSDTAARNQGVDLSGDDVETRHASSLHDDIDGTTRGGAWDIGADEAATEFVSSVMQSGGDYSSLSAWEAAVDVDLTASGTVVYSGTLTGNLNADATTTLYRSGVSQNISGYVVATTTAQILLRGVETRHASSLPVANGDQWRVDASNYFTVTGSGDDLGAPVIAVAKIDGAWSASDTANFILDGWTTGPGNYIKIYTTESARHSGKWDYGKYRLIDNETVMDVREDYLIVDGLQINVSYSNSGSWRRGISVNGDTPDITISNNIIKNANSNTYNYGFYSLDTGASVFKVFNNIIYGFTGTDSTALFFGNIPTKYIYNNTIYNSTYGMQTAGNNAYVKNNIVQDCTTGYSLLVGSWTNSDFNISSDATAPGSNSKINTSVSFVSTSTDNIDLHLSPSDTGAKNAGVNLSNILISQYPNIQYDIDGDLRSETNPWDIGADEISNTQSDTPASFNGNMDDNDSLTDGLVGHWDFNAGLGATVSDKSGNGNDGTWAGSGSHWTGQGRFGNAGVFNGVDDVVNAGSGASLDDIEKQGGGGMTISAWVKPFGLGENTNVIIYKEDDPDTTNGDWAMALDNSNYLSFRKGYSTQILSKYSNDTVGINVWTHVLAVWDGSSDSSNVHLYINGQEVSYIASSNGQGIKSSDASKNVYIGNSRWVTRTFNGLIDETRIYNRVLSQREINLLYNEGQASVEWHFRNDYNDRGTLCAINSSQCKNLTEGGTGNSFGVGYLEENTSAVNMGGAGYAYRNDDNYFDVASTSDFSLVATVKTSSANNMAIFAKRLNTVNTATGFHFGLDLGSGDGIPNFEVSDGGDEYLLVGNTAINDGEWHTLAVVFDEDYALGNKIYLDGNDITASRTGDLGVIGSMANSEILTVGRSGNNGNNFVGDIDRVAFYPYALTRNDVLRENADGFTARIGHEETSVTEGSAYDPWGGARPVAWWKLDEMNGTVVGDYASSSLDGTWYGSGTSTWHTNGKVGMGGGFNGVDDYVNINDNLILDGFNSMTWNFWLKLTTDTGNRGIMGKYITSSGARSYDMWISASEDLNLRVSSDGTNNEVQVADTNLSINNWEYISVVFDSGVFDVYKNGILVSDDGDFTTHTTIFSGSADFKIGMQTGNMFTGQIDDVKIYNYARTQAQVAWDYNQGAPIGHWKFDDASTGSADGDSILDSSGNGNHGTGVDGANNTGLSWTSGKFGNGIDFDGGDDYVRITNTNSLRITSSKTMSVWINPGITYDSSNATTRTIIASPGDAQYYYGFLFFVVNADPDKGKISYYFYDGSDFQSVFTAENTWQAGTWYNIITIFDDTANTMKMYVNGKLSGQTTGVTTNIPTADADNDWYIGARSNLSGVFDGQIDDARVYNYALTEDMVRQVFNGGRVRFGGNTNGH